MLEALVNQVKDEDLMFGAFFLARTPEGELVIAANHRVEREEDLETGKTRRKFWTRIFLANGSSRDVLSFEQCGEEQTTYDNGLIVPVEDSLYHELYDLWAESAADEGTRNRRKALVAWHWIAMDLPDLSGGY